ncbi:MAG: hypothetical protein ABFS42_03350 [Candidatus Krumholzibacteriota bacterium]
MKSKLLIGLTLLTMVFASQAAMADCFIGGTITASPNPDPLGPDWMYTMVITWDTGNAYSLSHANLLLDIAGGTCLCQDFNSAMSWASPIGYSDGVPPVCTVEYDGFMECGGDPSIPGIDGILLKFEPVEGECEPGPTGTATFVFYSNLGPYPIDEDILSVIDKAGLDSCTGSLSGDFPAMACDPVGVEDANWGSLKGLFR